MASDSSDQTLSMRLSPLNFLEDPPSPLINLRPEIWRLILQKVTQKDVINLRLVDKDFKTKVDNLYEDWVITLDEDCPYLDMILDLRLKEVIVKRLLNPIPIRPLEAIFKHPTLLKTINVLGYPGISAENLHTLLSQCKTVQSISIGLKDSIAQDVFWATLDPHIGYEFLHLHTLKITVFHDSRKLVIVNNFWERLMTRSRMPDLKSLNVKFRRYIPYTVFTHTKALFLFLIRQGQTLKHFTFMNFLGKKIVLSPLSFKEEKSLVENCRTLETLCFDSDCLSDVINDTMRSLALAQSKLVELDLSSRLLTISNRDCAKICSNNFQTFSIIRTRALIIDGERAGESGRFDVSIFSKCVNLKYLELVPKLGVSIELCNLFSLPDKILILRLYDCLISPQEISRFLCHSRLLKFQFSLARNSAEYGINLSVFEEILKHDSLVRVCIGLKSFIVPSTASELAKMNAIFYKLGFKKKGNDFASIGLTLVRTKDPNSTYKWTVPKDII